MSVRSGAQAAPDSSGGAASLREVRRPDGERLASLGLWIGIPLAITVLGWRSLPLAPILVRGVVTSWGAAMHMALHQGIAYGDRLIFTYGPLGFLSSATLWYGVTGAIAVLYAALVRFALALALFYAARRSYGTWVGALVALVVVMVGTYAVEAVAFLVFCVYMVDRDSGPRHRLLLMGAAGVIAGLETLNKISTGIELGVLALIAALGTLGRWRDNVLVAIAGMLGGFLVGWLLSGQSLGELPAFVRNTEQIVAGYGTAMGIEWGLTRTGVSGTVLRWQYPAFLFGFLAGLAGALQMTVGGPGRRRWAVFGLWVTFCFFEFKQGFVSHEGEHATIVMVALMGGFLAIRWSGALRPVGIALTAVLIRFTVHTAGGLSSAVGRPARNPINAVENLADAVIPSRSSSITQRGRTWIRGAYPLDPAMLALLNGHTVDVTPYQTAIVWGYGLRWDPLPAFQSYSAYTSSLDRQDAEALMSAHAPQRILRTRDPEFFNHIEAFDDGQTNRTLLCRYDELRTTPEFQVLGQGPNRCGAVLALGTVHARWYQTVRIPPPPDAHSFVFVRIGGVAVGGLEQVLGLLYKPRERVVMLDGRTYRLNAGTASDGLALRAPASVDFSAPFNIAPDSATIAVGKSNEHGNAAAGLTFSFYAQEVRAGPRARGRP